MTAKPEITLNLKDICVGIFMFVSALVPFYLHLVCICQDNRPFSASPRALDRIKPVPILPLHLQNAAV